MAILKKVTSATLIEALVATVLIVIIFVIASLVLNNLVLNTFSKNTHPIETRLNLLEYNLQNKLIKLPYEEKYKGWNVSIYKEKNNEKEMVLIQAKNEKGKQISRERIYIEY